jgi:alpha-L-fucosidase
MSRTVCIVIFLLVLSFVITSCAGLETRGVRDAALERTKWWRDAKFGMFIHWGLYAVPAGEWKGQEVDGYAEWVMFHHEIPVAEYEKLAGKFNPVKFNADEWVGLAKAAGMKYMVITSKHHDGFAMFDSKVSNYDIVERTPYGRDVIGALAGACKRSGVKFGCYYSIDRDWHEYDAASNEHEQDNRWDWPDVSKKDFNKYLARKAMGQVEEILTQYKPDIMWFDGIGMKTDEQNARIVKLVRQLQPTCLINSRLDTYKLPTEWGDYTSMDDNVVPPNYRGGGWENPGTIGESYGYHKYDDDWKGPAEIIEMLVDIVSKGGNYLLNVGPKPDGTIPAEAVSTLRAVGRWMDKYSESIYGTSASPIGLPEWGRCTAKGNKLYLHVFDWPNTGELVVREIEGKVKRAYMLADPGKKGLGFAQSSNGDVVVRIRSAGAELLDPSDTVVVLEIE